MKHSAFYLTLLAAFISAAPLGAADKKPAPPPTTKQLVQTAKGFARSRNAAKAVEAYAKVFAQTDVTAADKADAHMSLAQMYVQLKDNEKALAEWNKIFALKDASPNDIVKAHNAVADFYNRQKKTEEANAEWDKILSVKGASAADRLAVIYRKANASFRSNFKGSGTEPTYFSDGIKNALKLYQDALKDEKDLTNLQKIDLAKQIANCYLELMNVEDANKTLKGATALPGLTDAESSTALYNYAAVLKRELEFDQALPVCMDALKKAGDNPGSDLLSMTAEIICRKNGVSAAEKFLLDNKASSNLMTSFYWKNNCYAQLEKMMREQLKSTQLRERDGAVTGLLNVAYSSKNIPMMRSLLEKEIPEMLAKETDPKTHAALLKAVMRGGPPQYSWHLERVGVTPMLDYCIPVMLEKYNPGCMAFHQYMMRQEFLNGDNAVILARINKILAINGLRPGDAFPYQLQKIVLTEKDPVPAIKKLVEASDSKEKQLLLAKTLQQAAQFAMKTNQPDLAKKIWAERNKMLKSEPKRSIVCPFLENGPRTIDEFAASDYVKDPKNQGILDRKYGTNLKSLLETDATTTNRNITGDVKDAEPTRFVTTCDEQGVYIFFIMPCAPERLKNIRLGYGGYGGYEMYLAFGYDQPYQCYMPDGANTAKVDVFSTQYNNEAYRNVVPGENTRFFTGFGKDCIYMLMQIDWCGVMNGIPVNGSKWEFEPIHWERGGWTWGGSKSVHNRSSFGDIVFANMTEKNRTLIKHRLLSFAKRAYQAEFNPRNGGILEHWMDPELGDQKFYFEVVKPFCEKYGPMVNAIKADMTDEQINKIYDEAYLTLVGTRFVIQRLRTEYLERQLTDPQCD